MFRENPKFKKLKMILETSYKELKEMNDVVGNDVQECYIKLEILIIETKIQLYEFLIHEANFYNEDSIKILQKKLDNLKEINEATFIIRNNKCCDPIILKEITDYEFE